MAISDYAGLVEAAQKWCARSDTTFTNQMPNFIVMAEDRIYNGSDLDGGALYSAPLRTAVMETTATLSVVSGSVALPTRYLGARKVFRSSDRVGLDFMPPERFAVWDASSSGGDPGYYTIEAGTLKVTPTYTGNLLVTYYRGFAPLTVEANSNDLLTTHPMVYLSATLFEAFGFIQDIELAMGHLAKLRAAINGLNQTANVNRYSGANMRVRTRNPIP
jgi:hypothetical protein